MKHIRLIHFILFAILAMALAAGPAWAQSTDTSKYKVFKIKGNQIEKKNFTEVSAGNPIIAELEKAAGGKPDKDDIIFVHMPNPGTCVYSGGKWWC